jgi:hypothetical protein
MTTTQRGLVGMCLVLLLAGLSACAPEVGSDKWCQQLKDKPKGDWSMNEATDFAKHCILK